MDTTDVAMVSRIRVEVRGGSMEAAERTAFLALGHAMEACRLEGIAPTRGDYTDHFFNRPEVTRKPDDPAEAWGELGMGYAGRLTFSFVPMVAAGGYEQDGYRVFPRTVDPHVEERLGKIEATTDITKEVMVLRRERPVTEGQGLGIRIGSPPIDVAMTILDWVTMIQASDKVETGPTMSRAPEGASMGGSWIVGVVFKDAGIDGDPHRLYVGETLEDALAKAYTAVHEWGDPAAPSGNSANTGSNSVSSTTAIERASEESHLIESIQNMTIVEEGPKLTRIFRGSGPQAKAKRWTVEITLANGTKEGDQREWTGQTLVGTLRAAYAEVKLADDAMRRPVES